MNKSPWDGTTFTRIKAPSHDNMLTLVHAISQLAQMANMANRDCPEVGDR